MIPIQGTAAVLIAPSAPLQSTGYVPGNTLAAQHFNWFLYHLTAELNAVLAGVGLSQLATDDTQLRQAVGRVNSVVSTSGAALVASQFAGDTLVQFTNASGSSSYNIGSGAARIGVTVTLEALSGSGVTIINGNASVFLGSGSVRLLWDGSSWCKAGGNAFWKIFTSGSGAVWYTPWRGSYKTTVVGDGGGGGGVAGSTNTGAGGGGAGGTAISVLAEPAGAAFTYTIGQGGNGGGTGPGPGTDGTGTTFTDGAVTITGSPGKGGAAGGLSGIGGNGGGATGGQINTQGSGGGVGGYVASAFAFSGNGGASFLGTAAQPSLATTGTNDPGASGRLYGGGGAGACNYGNAGGAAGGSGGAGVVIVEF